MTAEDGPLRALEALLDREVPIRAIDALAAAVAAHVPEAIRPDQQIAIGLDANVVLRLADRGRTDVVDYLGTRHPGPLIVPGQVIQEFWNNSLAVIDTHGEAVRKKYGQLADEVRKLEADFQPFAEQLQSVLDEFNAEFGFAMEPTVSARVNTVIEALRTKAIVPFVPRARFLKIAEARHKTRTPPGFKDPGLHGDFYVWADFLNGLQSARGSGPAFNAAVFVTLDTKPDWSRGGRAHPLLVAEVAALIGTPFDLDNRWARHLRRCADNASS